MEKRWILRFRATDTRDFNAIKNKSKTIETRAATERYKKIEAGDTLVIICGKEKLERVVKKAKIFKTLKSLPRSEIMPWTKNFAEMEKAYYSYPGYKDKIKKFGIVAFWI